MIHSRFPLLRTALLALAGLLTLPVSAADTSAAQELQRWQAQAGATANAARGQQFFNARHGGEWSCASCHNNPPTTEARHASTGKRITALAPAFNAERFTQQAKVDKWFQRNCRDVLQRTCTAQEKADVMAYLIQLRR